MRSRAGRVVRHQRATAAWTRPTAARQRGGRRRPAWGWGGVGWHGGLGCGGGFGLVASSASHRQPRGGHRSASTRSRTAGATSVAKRRSSSGSSRAEDERAGAVLEGESGEPFGHHRGRAAQVLVPAEDVEHPPHRLGTAARGLDAASSMVAFIPARSSGVDVAEAREPAVGEPAGEPEHPGLERAEPDLDVVHRAPGRRAGPSRGSARPPRRRSGCPRDPRRRG